jgi:hypothetical protein
VVEGVGGAGLVAVAMAVVVGGAVVGGRVCPAVGVDVNATGALADAAGALAEATGGAVDVAVAGGTSVTDRA